MRYCLMNLWINSFYFIIVADSLSNLLLLQKWEKKKTFHISRNHEKSYFYNKIKSVSIECHLWPQTYFLPFKKNIYIDIYFSADI